MKTFIYIVKQRRRDLATSLSPHERKQVLNSLVTITLTHRVRGNIGMYLHAVR